jgi:hypothetical protein
MNGIISKVKSSLFRYSNEAKKCQRLSYQELNKYLNFQKTPKNKLILSFGAGRCGQNWFSKVFNSHSNWVGSIERFADFEAFYRFTTYYKLPIYKDNFLKLLELSSKRDMSLYDNSFIASPYFSFGVKEIVDNLNPDSFFFQIRNSIKTVESLYQKDWYLNLDKNLKINSPMIDISTSQYRSFSRIVPRDEYIDEWKTLSRIGKITWYLCISNKSIFEDFNKIKHKNKYIVKLEDINQNYKTYKKIVEIFNFKEILKKKNFLEIINKAQNKGSDKKYFYKNWSDNEKKEYDKIIEKFFPHYDTIKTSL